jgi:nucleoside-diphosphate-sugar epimerase
MKRLLVTGAGGLLGQTLIKKLSHDKYDIFALTTDKKRFQPQCGVTAIECNLLSESSRRTVIDKVRPEILIHFAWDLSKGYLQSKTNYEWLTVSLDLLRVFSEFDGKRFVFAGSSSEYDAYSGTFSENDGSAQTSYGICKRAFTDIAMTFGDKYDVEVAIPRYFTVYGGYEKRCYRAIPMAINSFMRGESVTCNSPDTVRDCIYVEDAINATINLLESNITGAINIASGIPKTMREIFTEIATEMNAIHLLNFAKEPLQVDTLIADIGRMKNELGYTCKTDFSSGLKKTIDWWRKTLEV